MGDLIGAILAPIFAALASLLSAILAPILAPIFELLTVIIGAILHFIFALIGNLLGASWLALHHRGLKRAGFIVMALTSAHLLAGIFLPALDTGAAALLSWAFSPTVMLASLILLLLSTVVAFAAKEAAPKPAKDEDPIDTLGAAPKALETHSVSAAKELVTHSAAILFGLAMLIGIVAIPTAQAERKSIREHLCDSAAAKYEEKVSHTWGERASKALKWSEERLSPELKDKLLSKNPCPPKGSD